MHWKAIVLTTGPPGKFLSHLLVLEVVPKDGLITNVCIKETDTFNVRNTSCNSLVKFTR